MSDILTCASCGAKNRVQAVPAGQVPSCARCGAALPWLHDGTDASFAGDIQASVPVIVDFWAPWCGPCRVMGPMLEDLARELAGKVRVVKVNVDENPRTPAQFGVQGIPTLVMFKDGQEVDQIVGVPQKAALRARVEHLTHL
ncbi:thioredoxin [Deinococcus reticulitermitis]|uniref:Thioredoxin n=1 Tax=Deinococcus reticulitermitis TaxID=856736 RepID=A0A1H6ZJV2_9DEIO|nr:thioredoxin [Deinococcus reticulitermitis]SEJ52986.1 thioredoxin [Deinococcus reticulitermitis]